MLFKSIEIFYDIDAIPDVSRDVSRRETAQVDEADRALDFRGDAIELIEEALLAAEAGEWEGAGLGRGEVSFGFAVDDFDQAEEIVRQAVAGTPFAAIREIFRFETDLVELTH